MAHETYDSWTEKNVEQYKFGIMRDLTLRTAEYKIRL